MFASRTLPLARLNAERIAIIKPSALGDIVHSLPVLEAVRNRFPKAHITWIVNRSFEPLLQGQPALDATLPFDRNALRRGKLAGITSFLRFCKLLRKQRFDLAIDLQGLLRTGLMTLATAAKCRIGLGSAREGSRNCYTHVIPTPNADREHAVDRYWRVADALGVGSQPKRFRLRVAPAASEWLLQEMPHYPRPWAVFAVGSRWLTKRWPPESFAVLAQRMQANFGGTVVLIGTPDEADLSQRVSKTLRGPSRDFTGKTNLAQLVAILQAADVVIANDTGPLHVAAGLGRPVVAPYTCTRIVRHGPYGAEQGAVETSIWCKGSYLKKCDRLDCMTELRPDKLWVILHEILRTWQPNSLSA